MPLGRRAHKPCRAAAAAGSPGGGTQQGGESWFLLDPGSGLCSLAGPPAVPSGHSGTGFLGDIPRSPEAEVGEGSWVGYPAPAACWGAGAR